MAGGIDPSHFLKAGLQRVASARILAGAQMYLDSIYLAGYGIECAMKAVLLAHVPVRFRGRLIATAFKGAQTHRFEVLKWMIERRGVNIPRPVVVALRSVAWSTDLRYESGRRSVAEAAAALDAAHTLLKWAQRTV